jgi:uncharacterized protein Veg
MNQSKWSFKDLDAYNGSYVIVTFNNGSTRAEGTLKTLYGTLFTIEQRFDDIMMDFQYDIRDVEEIEDIFEGVQ